MNLFLVNWNDFNKIRHQNLSASRKGPVPLDKWAYSVAGLLLDPKP